jgi:hypothetical protein
VSVSVLLFNNCLVKCISYLTDVLMLSGVLQIGSSYTHPLTKTRIRSIKDST